MTFKKLLDGLGEMAAEYFEDVFMDAEATPDKTKAERSAALQELALLTKDKPADIERRSLGIYLNIVRHIKAGGSVKFLDAKGVRTLKVPLR